MRFKKSIIVILLLLAFISIPVSFASDVQSDIQCDVQSDIGTDVQSDIQCDVQSDIGTDVQSDIQCDVQSDIESDQLSENNGIIMDDNLEESLDDEIPDESIDLEGNIPESNDESSQSEASSLSNSANAYSSSQNNNPSLSDGFNSDLPNLDTGFSEIEIICSDENTIFVNNSYDGDEEDGSQLKPYKNIMDGFRQLYFTNNKTNLFLAEGCYNITNPLDISTSINVIGENSQNTIISASNRFNIFRISSSSTEANIINLTLSNGHYCAGGAIRVSESSLNIINTIFMNNNAYDVSSYDPGKGGVIYNDAGFVKIYNSTFSNNSISGKYSKYGGVIYNNLGELSIFNSTFINNSIQGCWTSGGAIYNFNGFLTLVNSSILNTTLNSVYNSLGGAICNWNGRNAYIINSTISGNKIKGNCVFGSAIANKGVLLEIINSSITNNYANGSSAENSTVYNINGIYHFDEDSIFEGNTIKSVNSSLLLCLEDQLVVSNAFDLDSLGELPSHYDLREENLVTSVKNQSPGEDCWAFAVYAALESYLLKNENISYDFSENNMKNAMYSNGINGTDWAGGGNHIMAFAYLLRGSGPVDESLDPFVPSSTSSPEDLEISKYVTGFKYIPLRLNYLDNSQIKYAILQYGALYASVNAHLMHSNTNVYNIISQINNHALAIVGWDDNYSASNFANSPPGDGAWIVKNSWGSDNGDGGYYYISYYDSTFPGVTDQFAAIAISSVDNLTEYKSIYQYDMIGNTYESIGYSSNTAWIANQFTSTSNNPLKAFGLYTFGSSSYLVNVTVNGVSKLVQEGNLTGAGYHTVKLNSLVDLLKGDVFKIIVKLTTPDSLFPVAIESKRSDYSSKVTAQLGQSFISQNGVEWYDIAQNTTVWKFYEDLNKIKLVETNVCLKAYTEYGDDLSLEIKSNASYYIKGNLIEFNITIFNDGDPSGEVNISSIMDEGIGIVSYDVSKGIFDERTGVWSIDNLLNNERETLKLILKFNEYKQFMNISVSANSASYSSNKNISKYSIVNYASHTEFLKIANVNTTVLSGQSVTISLIDAFNTKLANKNVTVLLLSSSNDYVMAPVNLNTNAGSVKFSLNLLEGKYKFMVFFNGEGHYDSSDTTFEVNVVKTKTKVISSNLNATAVVASVDGKIGKYLKMTLKDINGKILAGKQVKIIGNNKTFTRVTDKNGVASLQINLAKAGTYTFKISFLGDEKYTGSSKTVKVYVKKQSLKLTVPKKTFKLKNKSKYLTATLTNSKGKRIKNKKVVFIINGRKYTGKTNSKGIAKVKVTLSKKKTYRFTVKFAGDKSYKAVSKKSKAIVK